MNFNIYVKKDLGIKITATAKALHKSRNAIINEALEEWLNKHSQSSWPEGFFDFSPIEEVPDFKALRKDLGKVSEDPLK